MRYTEWCPELEAALAEPFPREFHQQKDRKGTFVTTRHYIDRLNRLVGVHGWGMETPIHFHSGNKLGLAVGVTVLGVTKWNVGDEMEDHGEPDEDGKVRDFGSSSTNSWAQSFKRCMAYGFGMGLYLYDKDGTRAYLNGARPAPPPAPAPAEADGDSRMRLAELVEELGKLHLDMNTERLRLGAETLVVEGGTAKAVARAIEWAERVKAKHTQEATA